MSLFAVKLVEECLAARAAPRPAGLGFLTAAGGAVLGAAGRLASAGAGLMVAHSGRTAVAVAALAATTYGVRRFLKKPPSVQIDPLAVSPEGLVPGSPLLLNGRIPGCQVSIASQGEDGALLVVGAGIRIEDHLVTATHNCHFGRKILLFVDGKLDQRIELPADTEVSLAADVSAFPVPETTWARLGVSRARLAPMAQGTTVTITSSCDRKYSVGTLSSNQSAMGRCFYAASTMPGFSGSAYMNGATCLGLHCHGGVRAGGYEALYLYSRLKMHLRENPESSEEFLRKLKRRHRHLMVEEHDEQVILRSESGHYHLTTKELYNRLEELGDSWADEVERENIERAIADRTDWDEDRGEVTVSNQAGRRARRTQNRDFAGTGYDEYSYQPESAQFAGEYRAPPTAPRGAAKQEPRRNQAWAAKSQVSGSSAKLPPQPSTDPPEWMRSFMKGLTSQQDRLISKINKVLPATPST